MGENNWQEAWFSWKNGKISFEKPLKRKRISILIENAPSLNNYLIKWAFSLCISYRSVQTFCTCRRPLPSTTKLMGLVC